MNEFKSWLEGFLEGKVSLNEQEIEIILNKSKNTFDFNDKFAKPFNPYVQPSSPPYWNPPFLYKTNDVTSNVS